MRASRPIRTRADMQLARAEPAQAVAGGRSWRKRRDRQASAARSHSPAPAIRSHAMLGSADGDARTRHGPRPDQQPADGIGRARHRRGAEIHGRRRPQIPIRCAFGDFAVNNGVMTTRALAFDTTDTIIVGDGNDQPARRNPGPAPASAAEGPQPVLVPLAAAGGRHVQGSVVPSGHQARRPARRDRAGAGQHRAAGGVAGDARNSGPGEDSKCGGRYAK